MVEHNHNFVVNRYIDIQHIKMKINLDNKSKIETGKSRDFPSTFVSFSMKQL